MERISRWRLCAGAALLCARISSAAVTLHVEGVDEELKTAVSNNLQLRHYADRQVSRSQIERLFSQAETDAALALQAYGFYHARVEARLKPGERDGDYDVFLQVTPGEPVTITAVRVEVSGDARELPAVRDAIKAFRPAKGERLQHGVYESSKAAIAAALQANGFFDARLLQHRVEVLSSANTATVNLAWDGGKRYRFGEVRFPPTQFTPQFLRRYIPWTPEDYYSADKLLQLQQRLVNADYFSAVSVQPDLDAARNGVVPIDTLLVPAKRTVYKAGAYISTDAGPGVHLGVERRWLNDRGHKAGAEIEYSQRLESIGTFYRIPRPGLRNRNFNFTAGYRDEETDSSRSRTARVGASEVLDNWHGYTRTLGLQYLNGDFTIADEPGHSSLLFAEGLLSRKRADNLVFPTRGVAVTYSLRLSAKNVLSDTSLAQIQADAKWVRPAGKSSRLILRGTLGAMTVDDFDALPPELRFFAGGDRSIRGFDYQQLGETNGQGGVIGGKYLAIASTEYEHYFLPNWGAAAFVDAGDAFSTKFDVNVGAGIGLRWRSPVGIVRIDVGWPVKSEQDDEGVRLHVVIGPDL